MILKHQARNNGPVVKAIVGMTGCGKTQKAITLTREWDRVLYYDTLRHDYTDGVTFDSADRLGAFWEKTCHGPFRLIFRPKDPLVNFPAVCEQVYDVGNMAFVIEEAEIFCSQGKCIHREFTELIATSRHQNVDLICCTQAPKKFSDFLRSQAHEWYVFMVKEPTHIKYLRDRFGGLVKGNEINNLKRFEYLYYRDYGKDGTPDIMVCMDDLMTGTTSQRRIDDHADEEEPEKHPYEHD